ncbi:MarR family winged helix-turn-helix transcriptional regulator [Agarivorans sp. QJM3NY_29]|uniref:MarR family winged helix-turn-helix transcriptional regulator n=1 Tax=unclassified Agarivorans TaxID=2636026 RepID=UPI003D7DF3B6
MLNENVSSLFIIKNALLASRLSKRVGNCLSVHGISLTEYIVMHCLSYDFHQGVSRVALADHLGMSASGVTRLLMPMEKNKVIETTKNPRDSRQSLVKLSATGQRLFEEARDSFSHIASDLTSNLSQNQLEKLAELYTKVI